MMTQPLNRILYAEDEPDIQEVASMALEVVGAFTLKVCSTGQEAVAAARAFQPDLLLFDIMMPVMDGLTARQKIHEMPGMESIPTIFMTGKVQQKEVDHYKAMGVLDVIPKPFDAMTLAEHVQNIWNRHNKWKRADHGS